MLLLAKIKSLNAFYHPRFICILWRFKSTEYNALVTQFGSQSLHVLSYITMLYSPVQLVDLSLASSKTSSFAFYIMLAINVKKRVDNNVFVIVVNQEPKKVSNNGFSTIIANSTCPRPNPSPRSHFI